MNTRKMSIIKASIFFCFFLPLLATADKHMPFGGKSDVMFAKTVWEELVKQRLAGENRINVQPFKGNEPHGAIQQVFATELTIDERTARVLVKHNHGGPDLTVKNVYDDPNKYLKAVTIMFKRESGYDPDNHDWFWAKYLPDGKLDKNPKAMELAGRVAKGMPQGCIACHTPLGGADMQILTSQ